MGLTSSLKQNVTSTKEAMRTRWEKWKNTTQPIPSPAPASKHWRNIEAIWKYTKSILLIGLSRGHSLASSTAHTLRSIGAFPPMASPNVGSAILKILFSFSGYHILVSILFRAGKKSKHTFFRFVAHVRYPIETRLNASGADGEIHSSILWMDD